MGVIIKNLTIKTSPDWLQNCLKAIGITPKNNIIDITNFVLHHLGQPLHAFDLNKIKGGIIVKNVYRILLSLPWMECRVNSMPMIL